HSRPHEGLVERTSEKWTIEERDGGIEICDHSDYPALRVALCGEGATLVRNEKMHEHVLYRIEKSRGYEHEGALWSPGVLEIPMKVGEQCGFTASTESWEVMHALDGEAFLAEETRRSRLLEIAKTPHDDDFVEQLTLAADQFII